MSGITLLEQCTGITFLTFDEEPDNHVVQASLEVLLRVPCLMHALCVCSNLMISEEALVGSFESAWMSTDLCKPKLSMQDQQCF